MADVIKLSRQRGKRENGRFALGLDYGTESVRALVVDCESGEEVAQSVVAYRHGVISQALPAPPDRDPRDQTQKLPPDFALQHAGDYIEQGIAAIRETLREVDARCIVGVGVDFTACTILPIKRDGTPLMMLDGFRENPHAWVKLWKHHAAQPEADRINKLAAERNEPFLKYYSHLISSEWMLPKCWEIANHAPEVFATTDVFIDAGDWIVQQMTGQFTRNSCAAGYKGLWNAELGLPSQEFLTALDPKLSTLRSKWLTNIIAPGTAAGTITRAFAEKSGLLEGTPVSAATIDAHSGVAGMGVHHEGPFCLIMGTSTCHMALSRTLKLFNGYAGVVKDGIVPGFYGYESGQSAVGDIFGWFAKGFMNQSFDELSRRAAALEPAASGLIALDWHNGNRSVLMNANLTGMMMGMTLDTKPEEVYRALIEATAFGTRKIIESHINGGVMLTEIVACGGLASDPLIMQIYADVTGLPVKIAASSQAVALGAAIFGALAAEKPPVSEQETAGRLETIVRRMTRPHLRVFEPQPKARAVYDRLYEIYSRIHDMFGREQPSLMKELKHLRKETIDVH